MPTYPPRIDAAGFTLMEMLVVLTIMGIVAAAAVTYLPGAAHAGERQRIAALARQALGQDRAASMAQGQVIVVAPSDLPPRGSAISIESAGNGSLAFFPDGSTSGGRVMLNRTPLLDVDWLTGAITDAQ